jgi:hypothetical protein
MGSLLGSGQSWMRLYKGEYRLLDMPYSARPPHMSPLMVDSITYFTFPWPLPHERKHGKYSQLLSSPKSASIYIYHGELTGFYYPGVH